MKQVENIVWESIERIVRFFLALVCRIMHRELSEDLFRAVMQFVKFGIVGVSNTVLSYVLYVLGLAAFRALGILVVADIYIAQIIAFILSVLWSFYWNNRLVFDLQEGERRSLWKALLKTYVSYSFTGLFLNSLLLYLWVQIFHISEFIAPVINLIISVPLNFIINKFWAFRSEAAE